MSAESAQPIKVAALLPLSGPVAEFGVAARNGLELARRDHPDRFHRIEFLFEDSQYDNKIALSSFQKLRSTSGVQLVYSWGFGPNQAVAPVAEAQRFPLLAVSSERSVSAGRQFVLRYCYYNEMVSQALLRYLRAKGLKRMALVKTDIAFIDGVIDGMRKNLRADEVLEIVDTYAPGDTDFKSTIAKLKNRSYDALGVFLMSGQISQFYRQSAQLNYRPVTFGTDFFDSVQEVRDAAGAMDGAVFAAPYVDPDFVARYKATFGNDLQVAWAANGYDFAELLARVIDRRPDTQEDSTLLDALRKEQGVELGSAARYRFDSSPEGPGFNFKVVAKQIRGERIETLADHGDS